MPPDALEQLAALMEEEAGSNRAPKLNGGNGDDASTKPLYVIGAPELVGWPKLSPDCLPEPLYRYVLAEAERLNVDPCPITVHVIAACAVSASDAWAIRSKQHDPYWTQQPRVWACVVKEVGTRGTEVIRSAFWPIRLREKQLRETWQRQHGAWKQRQADRPAGRRGHQDEPADDPEPICPRLTTQDTTIEAAAQVLARGSGHSKLGIIADELAAFLESFGRYDRTAATRALWLEAYDGGPQQIDRIMRGNVYVPNWSVVVAGNIQTRRLQSMSGLTDDGLLQRFMTVHTRPADIGADDDKPIAAEMGHAYRELHAALAELHPRIGEDGEPKPLRVDDEAPAVRKQFMRLVERLSIDSTLPTVIRETAPKWSGLLARLSLIFHLVDMAERHRMAAVDSARLDHVTGPTVTMAATFIRRILLPNLFRLGFDTLPEAGQPASHARWIAGHILAHQLESVTARNIGRAHRDLRGKPAEIAAAMAVLVDAGWALPTEGRSDGARWAINPLVHTHFAAAAQIERERRVKAQQAIRVPVTNL